MVMELIRIAAYCLCAWSISRNIASMMDAWALRAQSKAKIAQLQDQIFRDACNTVHHLRTENDKLVEMLMRERAKR